MSYILDALKKAEQERHRAKVPTLATVHQGPAGSRRQLWPWVWIVAAVMLVNAGVVVWLLRPTPARVMGPSASSTQVPTPPVATEQPIPARPVEAETRLGSAEKPASVAGVPSPPSVAEAPSPPPSPSTRVSAPRQSAPERRPATAKPRETEPRAPVVLAPTAPKSEAQKPKLAEAPGPAAPPAAPGRPAAGASASPVAPGVTAAVKPAPAPEKSAAPAVASTPPKPPERGTAPSPTPQGMSPTTPAIISKMNLQVLVYSETPSERLVFINNQKYVEGQSIDGKALVERITPEGAVVSLQGQRFFLRTDQEPTPR